MSRVLSQARLSVGIIALLSSPAMAQQSLPDIDVRGARRQTVRRAAPAPRIAAAPPASSVEPTPRAPAPTFVLGPTTPAPADKNKETGYARSRSGAATKTTTPILDTPRSVVVVPKEVLADNQVINTQEAVKFVSGVQTAGGLYDGYQLRGFTNGGLSGNTYRNNLKLTGLVQTEDMAFVDRVEVVKGPVAMLYGRIQPGGLVNFVTKKPLEQPLLEVQEQFGSWGLSRTTLDASGPIDKQKTLLYRAMGAFDHADSWVNFDHRDNGAASVALTWRPDARFDATVSAEYYNGKTVNLGSSAQAVPAMALTYAIPGYVGKPANLPRNWTQNDPGMYDNLPTTIERVLVGGEWTYRFNEDWRVTNRVHFSHSAEHRNYLQFGTYNAATGALNRNFAWNEFAERNAFSLNLDVVGKLYTGPFRHDLLVGFDTYTYRAPYHGDNPTYTLNGQNPFTTPFNVFLPSYGNLPWPIIKAAYATSQSNVLFQYKYDDDGFYAQDDISYNDKVHLLLGGRYDIAFDQQAQTNGVSTSFYQGSGATSCFPFCQGYVNPPSRGNPVERQFSPNAGLLFKITPEYSVYSSFAQSFAGSNAASQSFDGTSFKPEKAWQYEIGGKAGWFDGRLNASVAAFELHRQNVITADPNHTGYSLAAGEVRSRGIESDFSGQLTDNISLIGSYTYDDVIIIRDATTGTGAQLGKRWPGVPRHAGNLWAKYDTAPGLDQGWQFGAGVYANGTRWGNNTNSWVLPGYARVDVMGGYRFLWSGRKVEAQLNVTNIGDARYFEAASGNAAYYGAPRTFTGSIKVKF